MRDAYERDGWTVEGPFVSADASRGAVEALREIHQRTFASGENPQARVTWIRARAARAIANDRGQS